MCIFGWPQTQDLWPQFPKYCSYRCVAPHQAVSIIVLSYSFQCDMLNLMLIWWVFNCGHKFPTHGNYKLSFYPLHKFKFFLTFFCVFPPGNSYVLYFFFLFPSCIGFWGEQACVYVCSNTCGCTCVSRHTCTCVLLSEEACGWQLPSSSTTPHLIDGGRITQSNLDHIDTAREFTLGNSPSLLFSTELTG